jgi:flavin reductase (DIM6/NTAB) family NADH-FMN oxidoreductase RutF
VVVAIAIHQRALCRAALDRVDVGDHTFFVAEVVSVERGPAPSALMYHDRSYHSL